MAFSSLKEFIDILEQNNELIRIKEFVNTDLEITEITDRISKQNRGGKALLFENNGTNFPILINALGSKKRINLSLRVNNLDDIGKRLNDLFKQLSSPKESFLDKLKVLPKLKELSSWIPKSKSGKGICQQVINTNPNLDILPILKCWPADGGKFITLPMVITKDPHNGIRNVGMYRMQMLEQDSTGMHWHKHKVGARHYNEHKELGTRMPVSVALGGDPAYMYSATAPLPDNIDEFMLAGFLRKKKVELVKCITNDLEVPADADIIIEGYVDPSEELIFEGPFGDHTGFYSLADWFPKFHVTCITHKKDAIYPTTIVGIPPQEDAWIGKATERIFLTPIKLTMLPELADMDLPVAGVAHNIAVVSLNKSFSGHALKIMNSLWGAGQMMFNKSLIVTDKDVNIHNYKKVAQEITKNVYPAEDIYFSKGPLDILDHSAAKYAFGGKIFFDATTKYTEERNSETQEVDTRKILINKDEKIKNFAEISDINTDMLKDEISAIIISVKKDTNFSFKDFTTRLNLNKDLNKIKFVFIVDNNLDIYDLFSTTWVISNNIDASRDCDIKNNNDLSTIFIDGTRKLKSIDNFKRDWPNIVTSNNDTIDKIDKIWDSLNIGGFIESPSKKYLQLKINEGAIANE